MNQAPLFAITDPLLGGCGKKLCRLAYTKEFIELWEAYPRRKPSNPKTKAWRAYQRRLKDGFTHEEMLSGVKAYAATCTEIEGTCYVMMAATFLGPDLHFKEEYEAQDPGLKLPADDTELITFGTDQGYPPRPGESFWDYRNRLTEKLS